MTVVAAIARDGAVVMAADTATNYRGTYIDGAIKIRRIVIAGEPALLAASGDGSIDGLVQRHLTIETVPDGDEQRWADGVASAVTDLLAAQTPPRIDGSGLDGAFLLGFRGALWYLFAHQAARVVDGVGGLGTGCDTALGAMNAALEHGAEPEAATRLAVRLACRYAEGCAVGPSGPLVLHLPG